MLDALGRHAKSISLIGGFLFGMIGTVWSFAFDNRLGDELRQFSDTKADLASQVKSLNEIASEYFITNQQGGLDLPDRQSGERAA